MRKADFHTHSTVSDGSESIERIINMAKEKGLYAVAITDHDTLSHLDKIPNDTDIKVIAGIEISSALSDTNTKAHILGYNIQKPQTITALTEPVLTARNENSEKQIERLTKNGFVFDMDKLKRADGKYLYKQHIMDWLFTTGQVTDTFGNFYQRTFKNGGICAFDIKYPDVFDAVRAVKESGGLAVLAHPGQQQIFDLIPKLVEIGLDGLELNHHSHSEKDRELIRRYGAQYSLFLTGGSDYHGKNAANKFQIGDFLAHESGVNAIVTI